MCTRAHVKAELQEDTGELNVKWRHHNYLNLSWYQLFAINFTAQVRVVEGEVSQKAIYLYRKHLYCCAHVLGKTMLIGGESTVTERQAPKCSGFSCLVQSQARVGTRLVSNTAVAPNLTSRGHPLLKSVMTKRVRAWTARHLGSDACALSPYPTRKSFTVSARRDTLIPGDIDYTRGSFGYTGNLFNKWNYAMCNISVFFGVYWRRVSCGSMWIVRLRDNWLMNTYP